MPTTTQDRTDDLHALEELWTSPAYGEKRRTLAGYRLFRALVAGGWVAFAVAMAFNRRQSPG